MALFDDVLKGSLITGLAIGIGAVVLAPVVIPAAAQIVKPLAKAAIKGGIVLYEKGRETIAEMGEVVEDLIAEAKAEMASAQEASPDATPEG